jgi:hypothetical protein
MLRFMKKKNKSCKQAEALVQRHLLPRWGSLQAAAITRSDVKAVISSIARPVLANQVLAACSAVFSWAVREELLKVNPCVGVERKVPPFWAAFDQAGLLASVALKVILLTGQRPRRSHQAATSAATITVVLAHVVTATVPCTKRNGWE